jgi:hypothetical protein
MTSYAKMKCWEIMQCSESESCPARLYPDINCWEIAEILGASQSILSVCEDCLVYIVKANGQILTDGELEEIFEYRELSRLSRLIKNCPAYDNRYRYENNYLWKGKLSSSCVIK